MIPPSVSTAPRSVRPPGPLVIEIEGVTKLYKMGSEIIQALRGVSVKIHRNEYLAIMGPSGSGKSTLMNMLGCLDTPTTGKYLFSGNDVSAMSDDELADLKFKLARVSETRLSSIPEAIELYREILTIIPDHEGARVQLEALLADEKHG